LSAGPPQADEEPAQRGAGERSPPGAPPLRPFGLVLQHDGSWTHEGHPVTHAKLREHFDKSVVFLPDEGEAGKYVVTLRHFRGEIEVEEAAFFVRSFEAGTARIALSDRSEEVLDVASLSTSPRDGALLCRVKRDLAPGGLLARFGHAAQAELLHAVIEREGRLGLRRGDAWEPLPEL
jgi:hypothetical protein